MSTNRGDFDDLSLAREMEDFFGAGSPSQKRLVVLSRDGTQVTLPEHEYLELLAEQGLEPPSDHTLSTLDLELLKRASERKGMTALARELTKLISTIEVSAAADIQEFFRP